MQLRKVIASLATAAMLSVPAFAAPQDPQGGFSSLQGIEAQALTAAEMQAISGALNAFDIAAALNARAETLSANGHPVLAAIATKLANYYTTNAEAINARYVKLGVFTECKTCP